MSVDRFGWVNYESMERCEYGEYVFYEEYAALEEEFKAFKKSHGKMLEQIQDILMTT